MKYAKIIEASSRESIFETYKPKSVDPAATPPVVDEDLPEPTEEESDTDDDDKLTREEQIMIDSIDRCHIKAVLEARYNNNASLDLDRLAIDNFEVLGQIPRGTPVEPMADPGEPDEVENTWTHRILNAVRTSPENEWTITSTAEPNTSTTSSGDASKGPDSGTIDSKLAINITVYIYAGEFFSKILPIQYRNSYL